MRTTNHIYERLTEALIHRRRKAIGDGCDYAEDMVFHIWKPDLSNGVNEHPVSIVVPVDIHRSITLGAKIYT